LHQVKSEKLADTRHAAKKGILMRSGMKRLFAFMAVALLAVSMAHAQKYPCATAGDNIGFLGIQTIRMWRGDAPLAKGKACEDIPTLTIFEPQRNYENGSAVLIFPCGSYSVIVGNAEGRQVADWFTARGFRAFVLNYRLSSNGYLLPVPLLDARRAIQTV
jgi:acetyl esterase/lipase